MWGWKKPKPWNNCRILVCFSSYWCWWSNLTFFVLFIDFGCFLLNSLCTVTRRWCQRAESRRTYGCDWGCVSWISLQINSSSHTDNLPIKPVTDKAECWRGMCRSKHHLLPPSLTTFRLGVSFRLLPGYFARNSTNLTPASKGHKEAQRMEWGFLVEQRRATLSQNLIPTGNFSVVICEKSTWNPLRIQAKIP